MNLKKWMMLLMVIVLGLSCLAGCKSSVPQEESAVTDTVVENDTPSSEGEQDAPEKVEPNETPSGTETPDEPQENQGEEEKPSETPNTPSDTPVEQEPDLEGDSGNGNYKQENKLSILDYNVRYTDDGDNKMIADRAPRLKKLADQLDPDLMGFQEATPTWMGLLKGYFGEEYGCSYKERAPGDESSPIFWKKDKFEKLDEGYFWLSETPDTQSKGWTASHYRICSWVKLKIKATGAEFLYFNAHWDGGDEVHVGSAQVTLTRARKLGAFKKCAMFLTADFNMVPWGKGYQTLVESGELSDVNADLENLSDGTIDGYNEGKEEQRIIDMCFYSTAKAEPVSYRILNEKIDGGYISDHRGLFIEVAVL